ncbi:hypothetical protein BNJ_00047 [Kaumoebavirus]|uniref:hypothetical protein n=1 Tax=Kaumoebavirus TaxID=1859492 RepID=UPI0009C2F34C|nr:hypothetical protein BNJ_00047 [Kaumoebavirus]ARA71890.1 hypothetical protein BNJ_00047 [Kaumoebavirus]
MDKLNYTKERAKDFVRNYRSHLIGAAIGIIVVLIFVYTFSLYSSPNIDAFLSGVWQGDEEFCIESELGGMILTLNNEAKRSFSGTFTTYGEAGLYENSDIEVKFGRWKRDGTLYTSRVSLEGSEVLPKDLRADISLETGYMILYKGDELYAELYKDNQASAM